MQAVFAIFVLAMFTTAVLGLIALINPTWFKISTRGKSSAIFFGTAFACLVASITLTPTKSLRDKEVYDDLYKELHDRDWLKLPVHPVCTPMGTQAYSLVGAKIKGVPQDVAEKMFSKRVDKIGEINNLDSSNKLDLSLMAYNIVILIYKNNLTPAEAREAVYQACIQHLNNKLNEAPQEIIEPKMNVWKIPPP